jgi:hypothetical protein
MPSPWEGLTPAPTLPDMPVEQQRQPTISWASPWANLTPVPGHSQSDYTLAAPGAMRPDINPIASMGQSVLDTLVAGAQGTSPHVAAMGKGNYQLAPQEQQAAFAELGVPLDQQQYVALRDPGTGKYAVYYRNPAMAESAAAPLGRMLAYGVPETGIPKVATAPAVTTSQNLLQDFERLGVPPNIPAVGHGIGSKLTANIVNKIPFFGAPVAEGVENTARGTSNAANDIANTLGAAVNPQEAGKGIQQGITQFAQGEAPAGMSAADIISAPTRESSFPAKAEALYDRFWSQINPDMSIPVDNTLSVLKGPLERFTTNPELGGMITNPKLQSYYSAMAPKETTIPAVYSSVLDQSGNPILLQAAQKMQSGGTLSVAELKELRSTIGGQLGTPSLVSDISRGDLKKVYGGITADLRKAAGAAGSDTLNAFDRATQYYQAGIKRVDALEPLLKGSPEDTFNAINRAAGAKGGADAGLLTQIQRSVSPEQWGDVGATVLRKLGEPTPGVKQIIGSAPDFSAASLVTRFNGLSDSAKDTLFGVQGSPVRDNLDALTRISDAQKQIAKFGNPSGTASHSIAALGAGAIAEHFMDILHHPVMTTLSVLGGRMASKALMSPTFARWLYAMPETVNSAGTAAAGVQQALAGLNQFARLDPSLLPFAQKLQGSLAAPQGQQQ